MSIVRYHLVLPIDESDHPVMMMMMMMMMMIEVLVVVMRTVAFVTVAEMMLTDSLQSPRIFGTALLHCDRVRHVPGGRDRG